MLSIILGLLCTIILSYLWSYWIEVADGTICVTKKFGKYMRVLRPGLNFLYPFEYVVHLKYEELEETVDGRSNVVWRDFVNFPVRFIKMDPPTINVRTSSRNIICVNTAFWWRIVVDDAKPFSFLTTVENPPNYLAEKYKQAVATAIGQLPVQEKEALSGNGLSVVIRENFVKLLNVPFIEIGDVVIQAITYPKAMEDRIEQDANRAQEFSAQLKQVETQARISEANSAILIAKSRAEAEAQSIRSGAEAERIRGFLRAISESGAEKYDWPAIYESVVRERLYANDKAALDASVIFTPDCTDGGKKDVGRTVMMKRVVQPSGKPPPS